MKKDPHPDDDTTASEKRREAIVERGLRNGLLYAAAGAVATIAGALMDYTGDFIVLIAGALLVARGAWLLIGTARRSGRRTL